MALYVQQYFIFCVSVFTQLALFKSNLLWLTDFIRRACLRFETDDVEKNNYLGQTVRPRLKHNGKEQIQLRVGYHRLIKM